MWGGLLGGSLSYLHRLLAAIKPSPLHHNFLVFSRANSLTYLAMEFNPDSPLRYKKSFLYTDLYTDPVVKGSTSFCLTLGQVEAKPSSRWSGFEFPI